MEKLRDWFTTKICNWVFGPPRCPKEHRLEKVSGRDDDRCIFMGDHVYTWQKYEGQEIID